MLLASTRQNLVSHPSPRSVWPSSSSPGVHMPLNAGGALNSTSFCPKVSWECNRTNEGECKMASNISIAVDETARGLTIRWLETGLERHVWVDQSRFEQFLASGETIYLDTPAIATERRALE